MARSRPRLATRRSPTPLPARSSATSASARKHGSPALAPNPASSTSARACGPDLVGSRIGTEFGATVLHHIAAAAGQARLRAVVQSWNERSLRLCAGLGFYAGRHAYLRPGWPGGQLRRAHDRRAGHGLRFMPRARSGRALVRPAVIAQPGAHPQDGSGQERAEHRAGRADQRDVAAAAIADLVAEPGAERGADQGGSR